MSEYELLKYANAWEHSVNEERKPLADAIIALFAKNAAQSRLLAEQAAVIKQATHLLSLEHFHETRTGQDECRRDSCIFLASLPAPKPDSGTVKP